VKNDTELEGMRACHIRDGSALIEYFAWLEHQLTIEKAVIDEVQAGDKLEELRSKQKHFVGLSFDTISSTGANAAVIHYMPERGNCSTIDSKAVYLCDSGAQYFDGTTDTTRTLHFGEPTEMERKAYTLVLKGNIALDVAVFPKGTTGFALDTLARQFLWVRKEYFNCFSIHSSFHRKKAWIIGTVPAMVLAPILTYTRDLSALELGFSFPKYLLHQAT
jgi:Xaa-Pro aminopeptidase